ncbi:MAG: hypothetical protein U9P81_02735, partial [Euryarchaeota archaeon]|nr:hypothetical protein [Euryarchaeota archaeon]
FKFMLKTNRLLTVVEYKRNSISRLLGSVSQNKIKSLDFRTVPNKSKKVYDFFIQWWVIIGLSN